MDNDKLARVPNGPPNRHDRLTSNKTLRDRPALQILLLLLITAGLYFPVLQYGFIDYDDNVYVVKDTAIRDLSFANIKDILLEPWFGAWQPVTRISHALDYAFFGNNPGGHHFSGILIHFLTALVLFRLLVVLGGLINSESSYRDFLLPGFLSAALFAVHPQHIETVVWIVQRKELLASLFCLLSIAAYLSNRHLIVAVCAALAMFSKPTAVVLPVLFVLLGVALSAPGQSASQSLLRSLLQCRWLFVLSAAITAFTLHNESGAGAIFLDERFSITNRLFLYAENCIGGLSRFVSLQAGMFHQPISDNVVAPGFAAIVSAIIVVTLCVTSVVLLFIASIPVRVGAAGILFYFVSLLPTGGTIIFGNYAFGDRYLYPASIGLYIAMFLFLADLLKPNGEHKTRFWTQLLACLVIVAAFFLSHSIMPKWSSTESVWAHDLERRPDAVFVNQQMGRIYFERGDKARALYHYLASVNSKSEPFRIGARETSALYSAEIYCELGKSDKMIDTLEKIEYFGGDITVVKSLIASFDFSGYKQCSAVLSNWFVQQSQKSR